MSRWLFKEEPTHYTFADLERDGQAVWDGVKNNLALQNLRQTRKGDQVLFYSTGKEKAVVGVMEISREPFAPPGATDPRLVAVEVRPVCRLPRPVRLAEIKAEPRLAGFDLVRLPRLSVMAVSEDQWATLEAIANREAVR